MTLSELSNLTQSHHNGYYELLLTHSALIIREVAIGSKNSVSKALHIHPTQFKGIFGCIVAHDNIKAL